MRDWDIRLALCAELRAVHAAEPNTLVIEEMGVHQGAARIDVAVLNGVTAGYEIKSPSDTLLRLPHQRDAYNEVFDFVTIVTSAKYLKAIEGIIPEWWGLIRAEKDNQDRIELITERSAVRNESVVPYALAQLLWKEEAIEILEEYGAARGVKSKPRKYAWERIVETIPMPDLSDVVREKIKSRAAWQARQTLTLLSVQE